MLEPKLSDLAVPLLTFYANRWHCCALKSSPRNAPKCWTWSECWRAMAWLSGGSNGEKWKAGEAERRCFHVGIVN